MSTTVQNVRTHGEALRKGGGSRAACRRNRPRNPGGLALWGWLDEEDGRVGALFFQPARVSPTVSASGSPAASSLPFQRFPVCVRPSTAQRLLRCRRTFPLTSRVAHLLNSSRAHQEPNCSFPRDWKQPTESICVAIFKV